MKDNILQNGAGTTKVIVTIFARKQRRFDVACHSWLTMVNNLTIHNVVDSRIRVAG